MDAAALRALKQIFPDRCITDDKRIIEKHSRDQVGNPKYYCRPDAVVFPETTEEVAGLMLWANTYCIPVTPRGAGSGLAGAAIPVPGGVVCTFEKMNRILEIDTVNMMVTVEPGVVTNALDKALEPYGLFFAGYPMSEDICFIGGNVAENAGGGRAVKYGVTGSYVLGAELVNPSGEVMNLGGKRLKDVSGYNILPLLVGSEGTLGIFTKIIIRVIPRPSGRAVILAGFPDSSSAANCVSLLKQETSPAPSSIEFMDGITARETDKALPASDRTGIPDKSDSLLLVEIEGESEDILEAGILSLKNLIQENNGTYIAGGADEAGMNRAWSLRKRIPWFVKQRSGPHHSLEDVVVPPGEVPALVESVERLRSIFGIPVAMFGHAGDGNFHVTPMKSEEMTEASWAGVLEDFLESLYEDVKNMGGVISGEHGIGRKRTAYLSGFVDPVSLKLMKNLKKTMDPNNILNPGVILD